MQYLQLDDLKNYYYLNHLQLSPDGAVSAVMVHKTGCNNEYTTAIYVDKGNGYQPLTGLTGHVSQYIWLDRETILFSETREKEDKEKTEKGFELTCFYKININGGEALEAFKIEAVVTDIELISESQYMVTSVFDNNRPDLSGKRPEEAEKILAAYKKEADYQIVDELPYWFNGRGFTNKKRIRLYTYSQEQGLIPLTDALTNVADYKLSDCKKYIMYTGSKAPAEIYEVKANIYLLDLDTKKEKKLLEQDMKLNSFHFWKDKILITMADDTLEALHEHPDFYLMDPETCEVNRLLSFDRTIGQAGNSDAKFGGGTVEKVVADDYYFTSLEGYTTELYKLNLNSGKLDKITEWKGNIDYFDIRGSRIVTGAMLDGRLQEIYELQDGKPVKKSSFNDEIRNTKKYSHPIHHVFKDNEGVEFDGWVICPVDMEGSPSMEEGRKYPAILNIHGGPKTAYCESYFHEMQYWANQNYFVLFANPRGSDGKGNEFADIRGKYGTIDYDNLMQFVDECLVLYPAIDGNKLGVTGGSYGGFMTNWIIGHTDRFAAAATQRSISNWISMGYISDIGYYFTEDQIQADPWKDIDKVWWHSPLKYIDKAKTPTLIIHSDQDYRCPLAEGYQLFTALKLHGVDTKMCIFHGENHELSRSGKPDHRVRRLKEITEWMDKYLK